MFNIESGGIKKVIGERNGQVVATVEPTEKGSRTTVFDGKRIAFVITEEPSQSGGKMIRAVGAGGYETVHYEG